MMKRIVMICTFAAFLIGCAVGGTYLVAKQREEGLRFGFKR